MDFEGERARVARDERVPAFGAALADDAVRAMIYEVSVNPKPGLVDPCRRGPHPDMDVFMFIDSALSLRPYFARCAALGADADAGSERDLFESLRLLGIRAERTMHRATGGPNTHKGAIFSLGILVAAASSASARGVGIRDTVQRMLVGLVERDLAAAASKRPDRLTAGERQFLMFGCTGARGEAEAGFPSVFERGLPTLRAATGTLNERFLDALMAIIAHGADSNLLKRANGDRAIVEEVQMRARSVLEAGGSATAAGRMALIEMDEMLLAGNLSLGGSADMLILTIFLGLRSGVLRR